MALSRRGRSSRAGSAPRGDAGAGGSARLRPRSLLVLLVGLRRADVRAGVPGEQPRRRPPADAIVVLGAAQYDGRPSPVLQDRLDHALELYEAGPAPIDRGHRRPAGGRHGSPRRPRATTTCASGRARRGDPEGGRRHQHLGVARPPAGSCRRGLDEVVLVTDGYHAFRVRGDRRGGRLRRHGVADGLAAVGHQAAAPARPRDGRRGGRAGSSATTACPARPRPSTTDRSRRVCGHRGLGRVSGPPSGVV